MAKTAQQLLNDAQHLLTLVRKQDVGYDININVFNHEDEHFFIDFAENLEAFTYHMNADSVAYQSIHENKIIFNAGKVNVPAIKNIIRVLNELI